MEVLLDIQPSRSPDVPIFAHLVNHRAQHCRAELILHAGERAGEGLAYRTESYNRIAHIISPWTKGPLSALNKPTGEASDGREAAVDRQLHSVHEARIV